MLSCQLTVVAAAEKHREWAAVLNTFLSFFYRRCVSRAVDQSWWPASQCSPSCLSVTERSSPLRHAVNANTSVSLHRQRQHLKNLCLSLIICYWVIIVVVIIKHYVVYLRASKNNKKQATELTCLKTNISCIFLKFWNLLVAFILSGPRVHHSFVALCARVARTSKSSILCPTSLSLDLWSKWTLDSHVYDSHSSNTPAN